MKNIINKYHGHRLLFAQFLVIPSMIIQITVVIRTNISLIILHERAEEHHVVMPILAMVENQLIEVA